MSNINRNFKALMKIQGSAMLACRVNEEIHIKIEAKTKGKGQEMIFTIQVFSQSAIWNILCDNNTLISFISITQ